MIKKIFKNKLKILLFLTIFVIACILRFYQLQNVPPGVNRDEASIGYTAYSLLQTGKDEYGRLFPVSFESFGDWKLPLYIYTVVPFVYVFGLSELAVRLPSVIFGVFSVVLTFYFVKLLFKDNRLAFLTMFLAAISPWSIHLSRVESESNTAVFLVLLGMIFFLKSLNKNWLIIPSLISLALTYFTYAGNHIFTTLLIIGTFFIYRDKISKTKFTLIGVVLFALMSGFIFYHTLLMADKTKISGIGIFGDPSIVHTKIEMPRNEHTNPQSFLARITHNKIVFLGKTIGQNYLNAFSPQFLFINGGTNHAHNIIDFGNMYLVEAPFLFFGLIYLFAIKKGREKRLILLWFLIAPIAASITKDAPHTNRMFAIFPTLSLITSFGILYLLTDYFKKPIFRKIFIMLTVFMFLINFTVYIDRYYIHFARNETKSWGFIYKNLIASLQEENLINKNIVVSQPTRSPYIFFLFYLKYDPAAYQKESIRYPKTADGFSDVMNFANFTFRDLDWGKDINLSDTVLVDDYINSPHDSVGKRTTYTYLPSGEPMFTIAATK
nr:phospholipid carrier-dependent glycosyltransferase [Candidatus Levybacteria bacterium]